MPKQNGKRKSPSVQRQLALALVAVIENVESLSSDGEMSILTRDARTVLHENGYENLESIPSRKRKLDAAIKDAIAAGEWDKVGKLSAEMKRAEKGLPPLPEKKPRKPRAKKEPPAETAPKERKPRKKKGEIAADPVLQDDRKPAEEDVDGDPAWLTSHPEPK